jgi:hypothetical protein
MKSKQNGFIKSRNFSIFIIPAKACLPQAGGNPGFPVKTGIQSLIFLVPCIRRDDVWAPAGVYPDKNRGRSDSFWTSYEIINEGFRLEEV